MKDARHISITIARYWRRAKIIRGRRFVIGVIAITIAMVQLAGLVGAEDATGLATRISDGAFAMLNGLNAQGGAVSNTTVGAVAIFAGDAQALSRSLTVGDRDGASSGLATLDSDRDAVDGAVAAKPGQFNPADWNRIKSEMAALAKQLGPAASSRHAAAGARVPPPAAVHAAALKPTAPVAIPATAAAAKAGGAAVETTAGAPPTGAASGSPSSAIVKTSGPSSDMAKAGGSLLTETLNANGAPPRVVIESRSANGTNLQVKGFVEGTDLRHWGIYTGPHELQTFEVGHVAGEQRVNFDIGVADVPPNAVMRVDDSHGRIAQAAIADSGLSGASSTAATASARLAPGGSATSDTPEIPPLTDATSASSASSGKAPSTEGGVEVFRNSSVGDSSGGEGSIGGVNTAEIPSHGTPRRSPSKRHTLGGHLGNAQVNITSANQTQIMPPTYELAGQIRGRGISRAGIYVGGRLVKPITVETNTDATSFDVQFVAQGDGDISVRAYSVGDQFVESTVKRAPAMASAGTSGDMSAADSPAGTGMSPYGSMTMGSSTYGGSSYGGTGGSMPDGPMVGNGSGIVVQIAAVGPITHNVYVVSGVISGRHLSGAGLYQNGMLVQSIAVSKGGIGGMLGSLIPGSSQNVNFNVRFNPQAGPAMIRAFDSSGGYSEQPVIVSAMSPYGGGGVNPYVSSPYGSPGVGISPYRPNPYAGGTLGAPSVNPYIAPTNPLGSSPPASSSW